MTFFNYSIDNYDVLLLGALGSLLATGAVFLIFKAIPFLAKRTGSIISALHRRHENSYELEISKCCKANDRKEYGAVLSFFFYHTYRITFFLVTYGVFMVLAGSFKTQGASAIALGGALLFGYMGVIYHGGIIIGAMETLFRNVEK